MLLEHISSHVKLQADAHLARQIEEEQHHLNLALKHIFSRLYLIRRLTFRRGLYNAGNVSSSTFISSSLSSGSN